VWDDLINFENVVITVENGKNQEYVGRFCSQQLCSSNKKLTFMRINRN
jgi:hypothetical protein